MISEAIRLRRSMLAIVLAAAVVMSLWGTTVQAAPASPEASPKPSPSASPSPDPPYYTDYLKDPKSLGFKPDARLFAVVKGMVIEHHPDKPTEAQLYGGVKKEVADLLKEAKLPAAALTPLPANASLPEAIQKAYAGKIDANLLWFAMIRGLLEGTDDPYSVLLPPKEFSSMMEGLRDVSFGGVGIVIELDKDNKNALTVVEPLEGTPASKAGLQAGDVILKIDGKPTADRSLDSDVSSIRGKIGTTVVLTVQRKGQPDRDVPLVRTSIVVQSVTYKMLPQKIGYIRLSVFGDNTSGDFDKAVDKLSEQGARGIIVDLRNNGGGYLSAATEVCSHFVAPGKVVTYTTDKSGQRKDEIATEGHRPIKIPVVLLVNNLSASASEITAGCLKDAKAATLIGVKTFGKGSVQQIFQMPDGAALKLTVAHFFTPQGNKINKVGVQPDVTVEMEPRYVRHVDKDVQMKKAIEILETRVAK